ncbi:unnamed protein product [Enterobius vermicularis]|uniref:Uncharacterized protein n=1 Tax=Enterobius vermicularis TaxID=51028 RepID=A0A0N4VI26_ENTVE|nr:unnamed protein product [Enterobius vermicularis]
MVLCCVVGTANLNDSFAEDEEIKRPSVLQISKLSSCYGSMSASTSTAIPHQPSSSPSSSLLLLHKGDGATDKEAAEPPYGVTQEDFE